MKKKFSCYIISETSLGIQCATHIINEGHKILGIISPDYKTYQWAINHNIQYFSSIKEFQQFGILPKSFDYLFSIVNYNVMTKDILQLPRYYAVNYHDSILPRYAGVHATSWAILNNESLHGVSWHIMNDVIDAGNILKQAVFSVDANETAFSFNLKCYTHAANIFSDLIKDIAAVGLLKGEKQNLTQRTYFSLHQKPSYFGFFQWDLSAEEIERTHRALSFGNYQNMFATFKILIGKNFYIPSKVEILPTCSSLYPGTIVQISDDRIQIATKTQDINIIGLKALSGKKYSIKDILELNKIFIGNQLYNPSSELIDFLQEYAEKLSKSEKFWKSNVSSIIPVQLPFISSSFSLKQFSSSTEQLITCPIGKDISFADTLLTAFLVYMHHVGNTYPFSVGFLTSFIKNLSETTNKIFSEYVPLTCSIPRGLTAASAVKYVHNLVAKLESNKVYLEDIFSRYPELESNNFSLPVIVNIGDYRDIKSSLPGSVLLFNIDEKKKSYSIYVKNSTSKVIEELFNDCSIRIAKLFDQIVKFPNNSLDSFCILTEGEEEQIIKLWNDTDKEYLSDKAIHQIFEEQVKKIPDRIAVVHENTQLTYRQLNERANKLANYLLESAVKIETPIAVLLNRSIDLLISILAISKAGTIYIPLDPSVPIDRNIYILNDSKPSILITNKSYINEDIRQKANCNVFYVEELGHLSEYTKDLSVIIYPLNISYIIYTSGSTGNPKGVMVHHQGMMNHMFCKINDLKLTSSDVIAQTATQVFDISIWQFLTSIVTASKVIVLTDDEVKDPLRLFKVVAREKVTTLELVPTHAFALLDAINSISNGKVSWDLRYLLVTGEALSSDLCNQFLELDHSIKIVNAYGPTECSDDVTHYTVDKVLNNSARAPIGSVLDNLKCYVLNQDCSPVPQGVIGELYIGGIGLARGYLNRADLTAERFIASPFQTGTRLYKTGDLAKWLPEGVLEYIERNDFQVKIRGYRIELGEIENVLSSYSGIRQGIALTKKHGNKGENKYLIGYYLSDSKLDENDIFNYLQARLPQYMVPSILVHLEKLPLTINGKLDRKSLPNPELTNIDNYVEPRNELERKVCQILAEILGLPEGIVGICSDFFSLGVDSIISIQLVSRVRQRLGLNVAVKDIFIYSNIQNLYDNVLSKNNNHQIEFKTEQGILEGEVKLLPVQKWFFENDFTIPNYWNQSFMVKVPKLDLDKLSASIDILVKYHDSLRLRYRNTDKHIEQYYASASREKLKILDITTLPVKEGSKDFELALQEILINWQNAFDIELGPIYSIGYIYGYNDGSSRIHFAIHHLAIDGISWRILTEDLRDIYNGKELSTKGSSYRQWVEEVATYGVKYVSEKTYWDNIISDYKSNLLDELVVNKETKSYATLQLKQEITRQLLQESNKAYNTEINDILLTALAYMLADITSSKVNHIMLEGHGREEIDSSIDITRTLGWFTTIYPVRLEIQNDIASSLKNIKESLRKIPNKGIGYGELVGYKDIRLPMVIFNYLGQFDTEDNSKNSWNIINENIGLSVDPRNHDNNVISINGIIINGCFEFSITSKLDSALTNKLVELFKRNLENIVDHCINQTRSYLTISDIDSVISQKYLDYLQETREIEGVYLVNNLQQGFIYHFLNQGDIDDAYKVQNIWEYHTQLEVKTLQRAWVHAQVKYATLRLRFAWTEELIQIIDKEGSLDWRYLDITGEENQELRIKKIQEKDRVELYSLEKGNLFRIYLIKQKEDLYTCLLSDHHTILDGWSIPVLLNYVHETYLKFLNKENILVTKDRSYENTQKYLQKHRQTYHDYWKQYVLQIERGINLGGLISNKNIVLSEYKHIKQQKEKDFLIEGVLYDGLKELGKKHGVTLNVILQYVWHKVLGTYSNSTQTVVGIVISGRNLPVDDIEISVGLYINTIPLIVNHEERPAKSTIELIKDLQDNINEISSKSNISLTRLQIEGKRLFDNLFVYENYPTPTNEYTKEKLKVKFICSVEKLDYPLGVAVYEANNQLLFKLKYAGELFSNDIITQLLYTTKLWLEEILTNPTNKPRSLDYLDKEQYNQIINKWNDTDKEYSNNKTTHLLFEEQVERTPDRVAVIYEDTKLTYSELNNRANKLAHYLAHIQEITPDKKIALCLNRNDQMPIAILAVLKVGCAYIPMDPTYPDERIKYILDDTDALLVLTCKAYKEHLEGIKQEIIVIDSKNLEKELKLQSNNNLKTLTTSSNLAYIIYSSGTTGTPKGVMIEHKGIVNLAIMQGQKFGLIDEKDVKNCLWYSHYVFDAHVSELYTSILNGHTIHIINNETRHDMKLLEVYIKDKAIDIATIPPILLDSKNILSLNVLVVAGEKTDKKILEAYKANNKKIINAYGPTETTVCVSLNKYDNNGANNIGSPISNIKCYVLDNNLNPLPVGAIGELYVGGVGLARGYLNRPELTAERFIANPFQAGTRLYKTGDLVRWMHDSNLEYIERNDFQVKVRGHRIELGEIETILSNYYGIKQSVVVAKEYGDIKHLVAYYISSNRLIKENIILYLKTKLPEYMVPGILMQLDALPITANGKLDRKALPDPEFISTDNYIAPRNAAEKKLCQIWAQILELPEDKVGIYDNFFELGGDSLLAIKLVSNIAIELDIQVHISSIFEYKTIGNLVHYLESNAANNIKGRQHEY